MPMQPHFSDAAPSISILIRRLKGSLDRKLILEAKVPRQNILIFPFLIPFMTSRTTASGGVTKVFLYASVSKTICDSGFDFPRHDIMDTNGRFMKFSHERFRKSPYRKLGRIIGNSLPGAAYQASHA